MAVSIDCWTVPQPVCEEATATVWENNILLAFHRHYDIVEFSESTQTITAFAGGPSSYNADMKPIGPYVEWRLVMSLQDGVVTRTRTEFAKDGSTRRNIKILE